MENHMITIENRNKLIITAVSGIDTFDEEEVHVQLKEGGMVLKGKNLHIQKLDLDSGEAAVSGEIHMLTYTKKTADRKLFKKVRK